MEMENASVSDKKQKHGIQSAVLDWSSMLVLWGSLDNSMRSERYRNSET